MLNLILSEQVILSYSNLNLHVESKFDFFGILILVETFGRPYRPARKGSQGCTPNVCYRIVQIIKHRQGKRLTSIEIRYTHSSQKRINQALIQLGYQGSQRFSNLAKKWNCSLPYSPNAMSVAVW